MAANTATVKNIIVVSLRGTDRRDDAFPPQFIGFELVGANTAVANALRRVAEAELPTRRLQVGEVDTNDRYALVEHIANVVRALPISQTVPPHQKFALSAHTDADPNMVVTTDHLTLPKGACNKGFPLFSMSGTAMMRRSRKEVYVTTKDIAVVTATGVEHGAHNQCCVGSAVIQPVDVPPAAVGGPPSTMAMPRHYYVRMISRGGYDPTKMMSDVCEQIITRLRTTEETARDATHSAEAEGVYTFIAPGETATIAELLLHEVVEQHPDTKLFTYKPDAMRGIIFRARESDLAAVVKAAVDSLVARFQKIQRELAKMPAAVDAFGAVDAKNKIRAKFAHLPLVGDPQSDVAGAPTNGKTWIVAV